MKPFLIILLSLVTSIAHLFVCLSLVPLSFKEFINEMNNSVKDDGLFAVFITFMYILVFLWCLLVYYVTFKNI